MKTLRQLAQEAFDAAPHDHTKTFDKQDWWEAAAQAVRAAVIDECANELVAEAVKLQMSGAQRDLYDAAATIRSLK